MFVTGLSMPHINHKGPNSDKVLYMKTALICDPRRYCLTNKSTKQKDKKKKKKLYKNDVAEGGAIVGLFSAILGHLNFLVRAEGRCYFVLFLGSSATPKQNAAP